MGLAGGVALATLVVATAYASYRFRFMRPVLEGEPVLLIADGELLRRNLRRQRMTLDEVRAEARQQSIGALGDVRYAGSGVLASAVGMDKQAMKTVLAGAGIPVVPWVPVSPRAWAADRAAVARDVAGLGWPVFVKPSRAGSSIGISKVTDWARFPEAVATAAAVDPKVVVEAAVPGREVECGVLAGPAQLMPLLD